MAAYKERMGALPQHVRGQEEAVNRELNGDCGVGEPPSIPRGVSRLETVGDVCIDHCDEPAEQGSTSMRKGGGRPHPLSQGVQQVDDSEQCQECFVHVESLVLPDSKQSPPPTVQQPARELRQPPQSTSVRPAPSTSSRGSNASTRSAQFRNVDRKLSDLKRGEDNVPKFSELTMRNGKKPAFYYKGRFKARGPGDQLYLAEMKPDIADAFIKHNLIHCPCCNKDKQHRYMRSALVDESTNTIWPFATAGYTIPTRANKEKQGEASGQKALEGVFPL